MIENLSGTPTIDNNEFRGTAGPGDEGSNASFLAR